MWVIYPAARQVTWARFWQNAALNQFQEGWNKYTTSQP